MSEYIKEDRVSVKKSVIFLMLELLENNDFESVEKVLKTLVDEDMRAEKRRKADKMWHICKAHRDAGRTQLYEEALQRYHQFLYDSII